MEKPTSLSVPRTLTVCAAICGLAACGDHGSARSSASRAALSAECSDPTLIVESQTVSLWPPNHKFHEVSVEQCISAVGSCEGALTAEFIWGSSDEPIDDIGDGHHAPDIGLGADTAHACVRSERQGPEDGRVYKLGVRVTAADGESVERECVVIVDHDRRGVTGADSGEAYRVTFDPEDAGIDCEGNPVEPPGEAGSSGGAGTGDEGEAGTGDEGEAGTGDEGEAGTGDEGEAGAGGEGEAGSGDEGEAGSGDEGEAGNGDEGEAGNGGEVIPSDGGPE